MTITFLENDPATGERARSREGDAEQWEGGKEREAKRRKSERERDGASEINRTIDGRWREREGGEENGEKMG